MTTIRDERCKLWHNLKENIAYLLNDRERLLALVECLTKLRIDCNDVVNIPEDLLEEVKPPVLRNDVCLFQRRYPGLPNSHKKMKL